MGLYDRDYVRASGSPDWGGGQRTRPAGPPSATKQLVIANVAVFLIQLFTSNPMRGNAGLTPLLRLDPGRPWEVWRLLTGGFCHDITNLWSFLFAMVVLWWAGREVESRLGYGRMLRYYLSAELVCSLTFLGYSLAVGSRAPAVGSAGAVMAVFVLLAFHAPRLQVLLFFVLPIEIVWLALAYVAFDLFPLADQSFRGARPDGIAHAGRLAGAVFAAAYFWRARSTGRGRPRAGTGSWLPKWLRRAFRRGPAAAAPVSRFTLVEPVVLDPVEQEVDRILAKIAVAGEESLSPEERATLVEASRRYREKQNK